MIEDFFAINLNFWLIFLSITTCAAIVYSIKKSKAVSSLNEIVASNQELLRFYYTIEQNSAYHWILWNSKTDTFSYRQHTAREFKLPEVTSIPKGEFSNLFAEKYRNEISTFFNSKQIPNYFSLHVYLDEIDDYVNIVFSGKSLDNDPNSYLLWISKLYNTQSNTHHTFSMRALFELLDTLPIPIWFRNKKGMIAYCNKKYADAIETTPEKAIRDGKVIWSGTLVPVEGSDFGERNLKQHIIVSGSRKLFKFHEIQTHDLTNSVGYALDYTQVETLEKQFDRQNNSLRDLLEQLSAGVVIYGADKHLKFFNHAYQRMYNMDESWLQSQPHLGDVLEDLRRRRLITEQSDFPAFKRNQLQMFNQLLSPLQELLHLPDERTIRMVASPNPLGGIFFIFEDVTDSLILERQAKTQMAVQKETLDNLYEAVAVFSSDNTLKLSNPAFAKIWKLSEADIKPGSHITDIINAIQSYFNYGDDWESYRQKIQESSTDRVPKTGRINRTDGSVLEFSYVPLPDGAHLHSYSDITDKYRIEKALRERNDALEEADKLKADFLSNVSYELKAPLNTIIGFTEILANNYNGKLNASQHKCCRDILDTSNHFLTLVTDIIDLATIEAGQMTLNLQPLDARILLTNVADMVKKRSKSRQIKVITSIGPDIDGFVADERRLKQALFNMVNNAIEVTPAGGKVTISALKQSNFINLTVADTGPGITLGDQTRIFKKFERTEEAAEKYPGIGLGLSLVKSLIELHGGKVTIASKPGEGTKITCKIPLSLSAIGQQELPKIA